MPAGTIIEPDMGTIMERDPAREAEDFLQNEVIAGLPDYELRLPQVEMLRACAGITESGGVLMVEAGTGTGKTFAYLIPLILSGRKAVVTTRTKNLQEQLVAKDLAFLSSLRNFEYAIAKGRSNYLCLRRLKAFSPSREAAAADYPAILHWAQETETGDFEELPVRGSQVREKLCSDGDACRKMKCSFYRDCFYFKARRSWESAQVVVANHALVALNAMLPGDAKILPEADVLVVDEGHALDGVLSDQIGISLSGHGCDAILNRLLRLDERGAYKGLLAGSPDLFNPLESLREEIGIFWSRVSRDLRDRVVIKNAVRLEEALCALAGSVKGFNAEVRRAVLGIFHEDEEIELEAALRRLAVLAEEMEIFGHGEEGFVRWAGIDEKKAVLRMAPIYPREFMRTNIVPEYRSLILTSATLAVSGDFSLTKNILGLDTAGTLSLPSPYDLRNQTVLEVKSGIDLRSEEGTGRLAEVVLGEANRQDGGILVLFTSREAMKKTWGLISDELRDIGRLPMMQGDIQNRTMLEIMREGTSGVIFGLESFWEGVDIRGDSLKCLIITKLPFEVPTEPMVVARVEAIQRAGGDPFNEYSLQRAILKFKQGFGRLIRSRSDTGRVIVCDDRVRTKGYGRRFLESLY